MTELVGKEEKSLARVVERTKPTLVTIGNRQIVSSGRWNNECMANYVMANGREKWIAIGDLARTAYGQNTPRSKERVRRCLNKLFRYFLSVGELLVTEYGGERGRAQAVKLFARGGNYSQLERFSMEQKLDRMRKRSEITHENYEQALWLLHEKRDGAPGC